MTAAVFRNTPASIPPSQNTAPVLEFNCLYTHDVKKKSKKWQDGFLRFHTFNKRVMVYDVPRNLIGDTHWAGEESVQEGDELTLDRSGVMVEVGDSVGQTQTDLTELRKSRKKDQSHSNAPTPVATTPNPAARPTGGMGMAARANTQQKHRSLNALLGTPKGPIGKAALPQKSPFEERHENDENEEWEDGRPPKRARIGSAPAWNVTRTTTTPRPVKEGRAPLWARTADAAKQRKKAALQPGQQRLGTKEIIDLAEEDEPTNDFLPGFSDGALGQSSSPHNRATKSVPKPKQKPSIRSSPPAAKARGAPAKPSYGQEIIDIDAESEARTANESTRRDHGSKESTRSEISKRPSKVGRKQQSDSSETMRESPDPAPQPNPRPANMRPGQMLRLAASAPKRKKTLLCQDQLKQKPKRISSTNTDELAGTLVGAFDEDEEEQRPKSAREQFEARLARIDKKNGSTSSARLNTPKGNREQIKIDDDESASLDAQQERPQTSHAASAIELRRLDDKMLPPASRRRSPTPPVEAPSPAPPRQEERPFRRAISDSVTAQPIKKPKRVPGAPVRYTPTPSPTKRRSREATPSEAPQPQQTAKSNLNIPPSVLQTSNKPTAAFNSKQKRPLQKSVSLNVSSNGTSAVILGRKFQAPGKPQQKKADKPEPPKDLGPWSREAFDLFTFRPPSWNEEKWCREESQEKNGGDSNEIAGAKDGNKENGGPPVGLSGGVSFPHS